MKDGEWFSAQRVYNLSVNGPVWQTSIQSTIFFDFLSIILYNKWTKQFHLTVRKWRCLIHSLVGKPAIFVAEPFLSTVCTWHTSRWIIWPKSYIFLSPKNQRTLFDSLSFLHQRELLVHDTNVLTTQQFCRILVGVASQVSALTFESFSQLLIFLHH